MDVEIGTGTPIFLFWEYLFRNFGVLSLQCSCKSKCLFIYDNNTNYDKYGKIKLKFRS
jgi:hypothetical protein